VARKSQSQSASTGKLLPDTGGASPSRKCSPSLLPPNLESPRSRLQRSRSSVENHPCPSLLPRREVRMTIIIIIIITLLLHLHKRRRRSLSLHHSPPLTLRGGLARATRKTGVEKTTIWEVHLSKKTQLQPSVAKIPSPLVARDKENSNTSARSSPKFRN